MACLRTFDNTAPTGVFTGTNWSTTGIFEFLGYSTTAAGTPGAGGNWPWATNTWGASEDVSPIDEGFYHFKYRANLDPTDDCYGEITFVLPIVQGTTDAPASPITINLCSGDGVRNIFNDSGLYAVSSVNGVQTGISGSGTGSPGYNAGSAVQITDDTYDPSAEPSYPVTRQFDFTYTPIAPSGYTLDGCDNCDPVTVSVIYEVEDVFQVDTVANLAVCNDGDV